MPTLTFKSDQMLHWHAICALGELWVAIDIPLLRFGRMYAWTQRRLLTDSMERRHLPALPAYI